MSLPSALERIVKKFQRASSNKLRYEQLLWYAKKLPDFPEAEKIPENKVYGCQSQVYITANLDDGKVSYQGDSDAQLVKGLVAFLIEGLNGLTPQEIIEITPDFIQETGLKASLTPSRANGFYNIFQMMKTQANSYLN
ncbi:SufE family protein [Okeania sp.]|uniref:SufE family protein n=1 Tax=Okeania sp. TaxID=3100323 RepID=UPI002B4B4E09|nr:SufE family protein [Okeania sp.]MEB3339623.1 SufE family protein [Okeania sp.]